MPVRLRSRPEPAMQRRLRRTMASGLGAMAVLHVTQRRAFELLIPSWLPGRPVLWNGLATAGEATAALLLARRRTARQGGLAALVTIAAVWVANIDAAVHDGTPGVPGWLGSKAAAVLRVPLQIPMLWAAWRLASRA